VVRAVIFSPTTIDGAFVVDLERREDDRGFFARTFCVDEFRAQGLDPCVVQCNLSFNHHRGTLRGMHYQDSTAPEPKLIRATRGAVWDVIIDMRPDSPTYRSHFGVELRADGHRALYVPSECAHGYLTLESGTEVAYQVGAMYTSSAERGVRYDDPQFSISWPIPVEVISPKDASWPLLDEVPGGART
jgi:dTDP-4-dehydrorhamnose 3,5-epimerase